MTENEMRASIIGTLFLAFGQASDGKRIALYTKMLGAINVDKLRKVCQSAVLTQKFLPTIAELTASAKELEGLENENLRCKSWDEAWTEIMDRIEHTHLHDSPQFSTPEIAAAVKAYGWVSLRAFESADYQIVYAQMKRLYEIACERMAKDAKNKAVLGIEGGNIFGIAERHGESGLSKLRIVQGVEEA